LLLRRGRVRLHLPGAREDGLNLGGARHLCVSMVGVP
jgi:hypothetical protein